MATWFIQKGDENVTIYDRLDTAGNGNVRFRGTIESALSHFAFVMDECDTQRATIKALQAEIDLLKQR